MKSHDITTARAIIARYLPHLNSFLDENTIKKEIAWLKKRKKTGHNEVEAALYTDLVSAGVIKQ